MKPISVLILAAITVALFINLGGCERGETNTPTTQSGKKKLYWVQPIRSHPVHQLTQTAFKEGCEKLGYACEIVGTDRLDTPGTVAMARQVMARGDAAGLAVWAGDAVYYQLINEATAKGIPAVIVHFPTDQKDVPGATGVVGGDPEEYAGQAAEFIGKQIQEQHGGKGTVAVTQGSSNAIEDKVSRVFTRVMKEKFPDVKVMEPQMEGFNPQQAITKASDILRANPDVVAAMTTTGGEPPTWPGAVRETGRKVINVGVNYTRANLDAVRDGGMTALIAQPLWDESYQAAEVLDRQIRGEKMEWWTKIPAPLVTKDELKPYYEIIDKADAAARK